jgi:hypothetical protein
MVRAAGAVFQPERSENMTVLNIPITKAKASIAIETDELPKEVYIEAMVLGLKTLANRGTSKITKEAYPDAEQLKAAALEVANQQVELIKTGKIRFTGTKKPKQASGEIMVEARRLAKALVKEEMKRQGLKISHYKASEITKVANGWIDENPEIMEQAKANVEARKEAKVSKVGDLKSVMTEDADLVAKAAKAKSKEGTLSAAVAGRVKVRSKGAQANA